MDSDTLADGAKLAPPVAVSVTSWISGVNLSNLAYFVTIVYTLLMIGNFIWTKLIRPWREGRALDKAKPPTTGSAD